MDNNDPIPPDQTHRYHYRIDHEGCWFCEGNPVQDAQLLQMLSRSLFRHNERYFVRCEGEVHPVEVADAPLWVRYIHVKRDDYGTIVDVELELTDGRREPLDAETLWTEGENAIYCLATKRRLKARLGKVAYYELASLLRWSDTREAYVLAIAGKLFPLANHAP